MPIAYKHLQGSRKTDAVTSTVVLCSRILLRYTAKLLDVMCATGSRMN